ncbi:hypothetical protein LB505_012358 [Fusarium chuoi]|nr:hypothetical protein LB505_012358 [Fusarium chuoi]
MHSSTLSMFFTLLLSSHSLCATNEPCYGPSGRAGVCITEASCTSAGGTAISANLFFGKLSLEL